MSTSEETMRKFEALPNVSKVKKEPIKFSKRNAKHMAKLGRHWLGWKLRKSKKAKVKPLPPITDEERLNMTPEQENQENNYQDFI